MMGIIRRRSGAVLAYSRRKWIVVAIVILIVIVIAILVQVPLPITITVTDSIMRQDTNQI